MDRQYEDPLSGKNSSRSPINFRFIYRLRFYGIGFQKAWHVTKKSFGQSSFVEFLLCDSMTRHYAKIDSQRTNKIEGLVVN